MAPEQFERDRQPQAGLLEEVGRLTSADTIPVSLAVDDLNSDRHDNGGDRAAIVYTVLRCCRLAGVDPVAYLADTLATLSHKIRRAEIADLMPAAWAASRSEDG